MAREIFLDTSFWIGLLYPQDHYHSLARTTWENMVRERWGTVTTNWTLYETLTFLSCSYGRHDLAIRALDFVSQLSEIVHVEEANLENRSLDIFRRRSDKRWSVVDCANFACIEHRQSEFALLYDRNFTQAQNEFSFRLFEP